MASITNVDSLLNGILNFYWSVLYDILGSMNPVPKMEVIKSVICDNVV